MRVSPSPAAQLLQRLWGRGREAGLSALPSALSCCRVAPGDSLGGGGGTDSAQALDKAGASRGKRKLLFLINREKVGFKVGFLSPFGVRSPERGRRGGGGERAPLAAEWAMPPQHPKSPAKPMAPPSLVCMVLGEGSNQGAARLGEHGSGEEPACPKGYERAEPLENSCPEAFAYRESWAP